MKDIIIKRSQDCGNSPKNKLTETLSIILLSNDMNRLMKMVSPNFIIKIPGKLSTDETNIKIALGYIPKDITELNISGSITHGKTGSAFGYIITKNERKAFSIIVKFNNLKQLQMNEVVIFISDPIK